MADNHFLFCVCCEVENDEINVKRKREENKKTGSQERTGNLRHEGLEPSTP